MGRKHNVKHNRKRSNYPKRLAARGLSKAPAMLPLEQLRKRSNWVQQSNNSAIHDALADL